MSETTNPVVDLSDDATFAKGFPHESFNWLRENEPVFWHEPSDVTPDSEGFWVISRYADVTEVQRKPQLFSSETAGDRTGGGTGLKDVRGPGVFLNMTDDPKHKRMRSLVNKGFTPKAVKKLELELEKRMRELLDNVSEDQSFNFVTSIARELPLQTICSLLGVPQSDRSMLIDWIDRGIESDSPGIMATEYVRKINDYGGELIEEKRKSPTDDILSIIVHARFEEDGSTLNDRELMAFFSLLFPAGAETTRSALAGAAKAFAENPQQWEALRHSDHEALKHAVEEVVRWTTPSIYKRRTVTADTEFHGKQLRLGDKVTIWEMSANRDDRIFDNPFSFDISRWPNKHVGFGAGVHFCLGASLARMEITVALREMQKRYKGLEITGKFSWAANNRLHGLTNLPMRFFS